MNAHWNKTGLEINDMRQMTEIEINNKHRKVRGSDDLKYPPKDERCGGECGESHYLIEVRGMERMRMHPCFLAMGHAGSCEFTSECDVQFAPSATMAA
jgi:hypothetical protein